MLSRLRFAVLCCAVQCCAVLCFVVLCRAKYATLHVGNFQSGRPSKLSELSRFVERSKWKTAQIIRGLGLLNVEASKISEIGVGNCPVLLVAKTRGLQKVHPGQHRPFSTSM